MSLHPARLIWKFDTDPTGSIYSNHHLGDPTKIRRLPHAQDSGPAYAVQHDAWDSRTTQFFRESLQRQDTRAGASQLGQTQMVRAAKANSYSFAANRERYRTSHARNANNMHSETQPKHANFTKKGDGAMRGAFAKSPALMRAGAMPYAPRYTRRVHEKASSTIRPKEYHSYQSHADRASTAPVPTWQPQRY